MRRIGIFICVFFACLEVSCSKDNSKVTPDPPEEEIKQLNTGFAKGADVSWITEMEAKGVKFYNNVGTQQDLLQILKDKGINSIRLRVWVNPTDGWNNTADVVAKATRAKNLGFRIMIDFHYSDFWADPGKQTKPAAWASLDMNGLKDAVYDHTVSVLTALKNAGITPEWVQVGNEINDGMLWEDGRASKNMKNYAELFKSGYEAVKLVSASSKVIVHLSNGYDNNLYRWNLDGLKANGAQWDIIGMSLYPEVANWAALNEQCLANMKDMATRYGSEVMVVEVGMPATAAAESKKFISDIILKNNSLPNKKGLGVFYWEPEAYNSWQGYKLGAFDDNGKPTAAMDAFLIE
ncbi:arabinogalactan endo-1,4-beta-galactosidase [Mucilaginibacter limnophilus]|uniref:Arabinogalactan endo-beta-1,4-galactanase n=1 Tax=Mucilaginibacter limnophilus TaxID=1932778 RepID=A0A3S2UKW1_9SPHI|nr:glycosyl hydrolase 53 family protein [Mucilaginibacter limnophilus]RVU00663.1 arabinogalactan endo-1,4-beta-galactosidase [Mucilaginibacter limnophilus]